MRRRNKLTFMIVFWIIFLPIWVIKRIIKTIDTMRKDSLLLKSDMANIDSMDGVEFEHFLAAFFRKKKYKVNTTRTTGDFGADLILQDGENKIAIQAKRYSSQVGVDAVREVLGAKDYYNANKLMVITNNYFTSAAKEQATMSNVILWDRDVLSKEISMESKTTLSTQDYAKILAKRILLDPKLILGSLVVIFLYFPVLSLIFTEQINPSSIPVPTEVTQQKSNDYKKLTQDITQEASSINNNNELVHDVKLDELTNYRNGRYGFSIDYPSAFIKGQTPANGDGLSFYSQDKSAELTASGVNNTNGYTVSAYLNLLDENIRSSAAYQLIQDNWYVISWGENGKIYYEKRVVGTGSIMGFIFSYPQDEAAVYNPLTEQISKSFIPGDVNQSH